MFHAFSCFPSSESKAVLHELFEIRMIAASDSADLRHAVSVAYVYHINPPRRGQSHISHFNTLDRLVKKASLQSDDHVIHPTVFDACHVNHQVAENVQH